MPVSCDGVDPIVAAADFIQQTAATRTVEMRQRVGAEKGDRMNLDELVPQILEPKGRGTVGTGDQHVDELAINGHRFRRFHSCRHDSVQVLPQAVFVEGASSRACRQEFSRVHEFAPIRVDTVGRNSSTIIAL